MLRQSKIFFLLLTLNWLAACSLPLSDGVPSQLDVEVKNAPRSYMDPQTEKASEAMYQYLMGQISVGKEDFDAALKNFSRASELVERPEPLLNAKLAELYVRSGDLEKALLESQKAIESEPQNTHHLLLHAGILESLKRYDEAEPIYLRAIEAKSDLIDGYVLLAALYTKTSKVDQAISLLHKLIQRSPNESIGYYYLGRAFEIKGDLAQAEKWMREARSRLADNAELSLELVRILLKQKKSEAAQEVCNEILNKDPQNVLARKVLGQIMIGENRFDDALEHLQVLEKLEENSTETRFKIALIQIQRRNFKEAATELALVLAQDENHAEARFYLASVYAALGRNKEAIEELLKIDEDSELFLKSQMFAGFIARQEGDLDSAEKALRRAYDKNSSDERAVAYLVMILREKRKFKEANELLDKSLESNPDNDRLLYQQAVVLHDLGQEGESLQAMEKVLQVNPRHSDALNYVAYGLVERRQDLDRAFKLIQDALSVKPNDGFYLDTLGWLYYQRGQYKEAESILSRAVSASAEDIVVLEHYADCLEKLKDFKKAYDSLMIAYEKSKNSTDTDEQKLAGRIKIKLDALLRNNPNIVAPSKLP